MVVALLLKCCQTCVFPSSRSSSVQLPSKINWRHFPCAAEQRHLRDTSGTLGGITKTVKNNPDPLKKPEHGAASQGGTEPSGLRLLFLWWRRVSSFIRLLCQTLVLNLLGVTCVHSICLHISWRTDWQKCKKQKCLLCRLHLETDKI